MKALCVALTPKSSGNSHGAWAALNLTQCRHGRFSLATVIVSNSTESMPAK